MIPTCTDLAISVAKGPGRGDAALAVPIFKQTRPADVWLKQLADLGVSDAVANAVAALVKAQVAKGKANELTPHLVEGATANAKPTRLFVVGLGDAEKLSAESFRELGATLAKACKRQELSALSVVLPPVPEALPGRAGAEAIPGGREVAIESVALGFSLAAFTDVEFRGTLGRGDQESKPRVPKLKLTVVVDSLDAAARKACANGVALGEAQNFARTIAFRPGNELNPLTLASVCQSAGKELGLKVKVLTDKQLAELGCGGIVRVGQGSTNTPSRLIAMEYTPASSGKGAKKRATKPQKPLLAVGKAVTFDTGGISIKPAANMQKMVFDKCGGMAVLGFMYAVAKLKPKTPVVGILGAAENHVSANAYRPGDVLTMHNGVTVEVTNTDAEGRLVLGDSMSWGIETYKPRAVVNLCTLTGGVVVALGKRVCGVMSSDDDFCTELMAAAEEAGERCWRLPLDDDYREQMKASDVADCVNSGGREAHPIQGGAFLSFFVPEGVPWVHMDIAGTADTERELPLFSKGATGFGVRTLMQLVRRMDGASRG